MELMKVEGDIAAAALPFDGGVSCTIRSVILKVVMVKKTTMMNKMATYLLSATVLFN